MDAEPIRAILLDMRHVWTDGTSVYVGTKDVSQTLHPKVVHNYNANHTLAGHAEYADHPRDRRPGVVTLASKPIHRDVLPVDRRRLPYLRQPAVPTIGHNGNPGLRSLVTGREHSNP